MLSIKCNHSSFVPVNVYRMQALKVASTLIRSFSRNSLVKEVLTVIFVYFIFFLLLDQMYYL